MWSGGQPQQQQMNAPDWCVCDMNQGVGGAGKGESKEGDGSSRIEELEKRVKVPLPTHILLFSMRK
jgi:hypothetical protein